MAVAKIDAHRPDVLLVEKSVSRFAQEYLLAKDISLVLNIKRPLLERIARCTGAQIVPSIDQLSSPKLGYCEIFHVERFMEDLRTSGQRGKRSVKTLMFFEGCPKPLGCTVSPQYLYHQICAYICFPFRIMCESMFVSVGMESNAPRISRNEGVKTSLGMAELRAFAWVLLSR